MLLLPGGRLPPRGGDCGGPNPGGRCGVGRGRGGIIGWRGGNGIGW